MKTLKPVKELRNGLSLAEEMSQAINFFSHNYGEFKVNGLNYILLKPLKQRFIQPKYGYSWMSAPCICREQASDDYQMLYIARVGGFFGEYHEAILRFQEILDDLFPWEVSQVNLIKEYRREVSKF